MRPSRRGVRRTCQDATGDAWDALDLRDVVVGEVLVAGGVEGLGVAEGPPQLGGHRVVVYLHHLGAHVVRFRQQRSVSQNTDPVAVSPQGAFWLAWWIPALMLIFTIRL